LDEAHSWNRESFTAAQAANWKQGGFDLREAKDARKKGLAPIQQEQSVSEGTAPGAAAANPEALEDSASATAVDSAADIIEDEIDTASFAN
jgi:hypothetical protein